MKSSEVVNRGSKIVILKIFKRKKSSQPLLKFLIFFSIFGFVFDARAEVANFVFYGAKVEIQLDNSIKEIKINEISQNGLDKYFAEIEKRDTKQTLDLLLKYKSSLNLDNAGYCLFIEHF